MSLPGARNSQIPYLSRLALLCTLLSSVWLTSGCGGRWRTFMEVPDDDGTVTAGGGGAAGSAGASQAGAPNIAGAAGTISTGGASACDPATCVTPECPDGSAPSLVTGDCCFSCQPTCHQDCEQCQPGLHQETHSGDCCPTCMPDTPASAAACKMGQVAYAAVRDRLAYKDSYGCTSDAECTIAAPNNRCEVSCGFTALFYQSIDDFTQGTNTEADVDCGTCPQFGLPKCAAPMAPHCYSGQCAFMQP